MSEKYPPPADCITVWLSQDRSTLHIALDPVGGDAKGTVVRLPLSKCEVARTDGGAIKASSSGWAILLDILRERQNAVNKAEKMYLSSRARPTQIDVEKILTHIQRYDSKGEKEVPIAGSLDDLGLGD